MLTSGDIVTLNLGVPEGSEAGLRRPAVVVTADRVLRHGPRVVQVVPLTTRLRGYESEVTIEHDSSNGLAATSAAQCQHIRAVATSRIEKPVGKSVLLLSLRSATRSRCCSICDAAPARKATSMLHRRDS